MVLIKYFKNLFISILFWFKNPPKIGNIQIDKPENVLDQNIKVDQQKLEVNLEDWQDTIHAVFETDNFVTDGINRATRPNDEVLKKQIQLFFKDYRKVIQKTDQIYTKNQVKCEYEDVDNF